MEFGKDQAWRFVIFLIFHISLFLENEMQNYFGKMSAEVQGPKQAPTQLCNQW